MPYPRFPMALAALNGFLAVGLGAFGAHALADPQAQAWIQTATLFQLPHAVAVVALLAWRPGCKAVRMAAWAMALGSLIFAGALQGLALGAPRGLAMLAPLGGVSLLLGWALLGWAAMTQRR